MKAKLSGFKPDIKTGLAILATFFILFFDVWALAGIFNDRVTIFRFLNYFGYYVPAAVFVITAFAMFCARRIGIRIALVALALPAFVLPYLLAASSFSGAKWALTNSGEAKEISVVTFSKMSRNTDYERVAQLLDCTRTDIILLQEVPDFEKLLAERPEISRSCNYSFEGGLHKSLALLTKFPIVSTAVERTHTSFVVDVEGAEIKLITARLDKSLKTGGVEVQSEQVSDILNAVPEDMPVIVAGDFNSTPHNGTIYRMKEAMASAVPEGSMFSTFTFPAEGRWYARFGPLIRIDHIFFRGLGLTSSEVLDDSFGSDHYPVRASFTLPAPLETSNE